MSTSGFDRLDELSHVPTSSSHLIDEAVWIMDSLATGTQELAILVERYGNSTAPNVAPVITSLVATRAQQPSPEMAQVVLRLVAAFNCWSPAETVMNALTAVQHMLHYVDAAAGDSLRPVSAFLRKCLDYEGRHWIIIKGHALSLLSILETRGLTSKVFTSTEIGELNEKIEEFRRTASEELGPELREIENPIRK